MIDNFDIDYLEEPPERPRDRKVDEAMGVLPNDYFPRGSRNVYYGRQLEVALERSFFHWITSRALRELVRENAIHFSVEKTERYNAHFYWTYGHRYPRRQMKQTLGLIDEFSEPVFTRALGHKEKL